MRAGPAASSFANAAAACFSDFNITCGVGASLNNLSTFLNFFAFLVFVVVDLVLPVLVVAFAAACASDADGLDFLLLVDLVLFFEAGGLEVLLLLLV